MTTKGYLNGMLVTGLTVKHKKIIIFFNELLNKVCILLTSADKL